MSARALHLAAACGLAVGLVPVHAARADSDLEALLSESVESTSGKSAGGADSAPALSLNVTAEDLRRHGIRTLAEAYNFLTMGLVAQDPLGDPEVGSRGVLFPGDRGKHVLLLLDGHTLNDQESGASFHGHGFGVPIELIDHLEVVLGPGSVLYGGNAMFGVINVITKRAKDFSGVRAFADAAFSPPLNGSRGVLGPAEIKPYLPNLGTAYRVGLGGGTQFKLAGVPVELTTALEYYTFAGPTMTWGPQPSAGVSYGARGTVGVWGGQTTASYYEQTPSGYVRLVAGEFDLTVRALTTRVSSPYVRRTEQPLDVGDFDDPDTYRSRHNVGVELKWHHNLSQATSILARLYGDTTGESGRLHYHATARCMPPFRVRSFEPCTMSNSGYANWAGTEVQLNTDWLHDASLVTLVGADARVRGVGYQNALKSEVTSQRITFGDVDRVEQAAAVYAQQVYRPAPWLILNGGVRWDVDSDFGNRISPRGALIVEGWDGGTVKAIYSEAMRAPTTDERTFRDPQLALQAQGLQPESVRSVEAIFQQRFGAQSIVFGLFRSWWSNMIVRHELNNYDYQITDDTAIISRAQQAGLLATNIKKAFQYQNLGSIDNFGWNGGYDGSLMAGRLAYALNLTAAYARSATPQGSRLLTVTPSWFGNARVSYDLARGRPVVALAARFGGKRLADAGEDARFPALPYAPPELDLRGTLTGPSPWTTKLSYQLMGNYSFAPTSPYTAGRVKTASDAAVPELIPNNRFTIMIGLQYNL